MKMTNDKFTDIVNKDKDYLEKYQLETSEGTKKYKDKFHKNKKIFLIRRDYIRKIKYNSKTI